MRGIVEQRAGIGAETGIKRQIVGPHQDADQIDLEQAEPRQHPLEDAAGDATAAPGFGIGKTLRGQARSGGPQRVTGFHS